MVLILPCSTLSYRLQAEAAGYAEGFLTRKEITRYYQEFIHRDLCGVSADFCRWTRELLSRQRRWQEEQIRLKGQEDSYWEQVGLFYVQMDALKQGWQVRSASEGDSVPENFDLNWFADFINFLPDISDYIHQYKAELAAKQGVGLRTSLPTLPKPAVPSCSVLVKHLPNSGQLVVGHATWHDYRALGHRFLKLYSLPYTLATGGIVPGHTISMTSYPGSLYSLDDFYVISSGLVTTESTLFVYDKSLYERNTPEGSVWEPVRAMTANRLSRTGSEWGGVFERANSGTYNNQWMVAETKSGRLWVTEQLPGKVTSKEVTEQVRLQGYWASYNRWMHSRQINKYSSFVNQYQGSVSKYLLNLWSPRHGDKARFLVQPRRHPQSSAFQSRAGKCTGRGEYDRPAQIEQVHEVCHRST